MWVRGMCLHGNILNATTVHEKGQWPITNAIRVSLFLYTHAGIALIRRVIFAVDELVLDVEEAREGTEFSFSSGSLADDSEGNLSSFWSFS